MNCTICGKPIVLVPSATERAKKFGGKPSDYTRLFTTHSTCAVEKRSAEAVALMRKHHENYVQHWSSLHSTRPGHHR
jgi:hypothetical protein